MKTIISLALILSSSTLMAAAKAPNCPRGTQALHKCVATPEEGDSEFATGTIQSISICTSGPKFILAAIDANGKYNSGEVVAEVRAGGSTYSLSEDGVDFRFSVVTGMFQSTTKAQLYLEVKEARTSGTTTFTCK